MNIETIELSFEILFSLLVIMVGIYTPIFAFQEGYVGGVILLSPVYLFLIYLGCISIEDVVWILKEEICKN